MPQSRALATRQAIIDTAVEMFSTTGYAETSVNDIAARVGVTTGAFYYHFTSKEALAAEIVAQGWPKALAVLDRWLDASAPGLENVIVMTFALSELMKRDRSVWIANYLNQAFGQLSEDGRAKFKVRAATFVDRVAGALTAADLRDGVDARDVGSLVWVSVHGCHLLSDAMSDSVFGRLVVSWQAILGYCAPAAALDYFGQFVERTAAKYGQSTQLLN